VAVLGSTGSIGVQALEVIDRSPELELYSVLCRSRGDLLNRQIDRYRPSAAFVTYPPEGYTGSALTGPDSLERAVEGADIVLNGIVGSDGLRASLLAVEKDKPLALANKESLVVGGELLRDFISRGRLVPVDSEHSTVFRCLAGEERPVSRILLTASGGSLRNLPLDEVASATPAEVLAHPTWEMGPRITVDSASMVNKAFEVLEAGWLFPGIPAGVVLHTSSIVHSLVRLADGSWKALLGTPDMRIPVQFALLWPSGHLERISDDSPLDWPELTFAPLDNERYPAFGLVLRAGEEGGTAPAVANAADEVAVEAFLDEKILFGDIPGIIEEVLSTHDSRPLCSIEDVTDADSWARRTAARIVEEKC
jgi:1-deoxy-D-xylulose-5-phosphate reductoisomerase